MEQEIELAPLRPGTLGGFEFSDTFPVTGLPGPYITIDAEENPPDEIDHRYQRQKCNPDTITYPPYPGE